MKESVIKNFLKSYLFTVAFFVFICNSMIKMKKSNHKISLQVIYNLCTQLCSVGPCKTETTWSKVTKQCHSFSTVFVLLLVIAILKVALISLSLFSLSSVESIFVWMFIFEEETTVSLYTLHMFLHEYLNYCNIFVAETFGFHVSFFFCKSYLDAECIFICIFLFSKT